MCWCWYMCCYNKCKYINIYIYKHIFHFNTNMHILYNIYISVAMMLFMYHIKDLSHSCNAKVHLLSWSASCPSWVWTAHGHRRPFALGGRSHEGTGQQFFFSHDEINQEQQRQQQRQQPKYHTCGKTSMYVKPCRVYLKLEVLLLSRGTDGS